MAIQDDMVCGIARTAYPSLQTHHLGTHKQATSTRRSTTTQRGDHRALPVGIRLAVASQEPGTKSPVLENTSHLLGGSYSPSWPQIVAITVH